MKSTKITTIVICLILISTGIVISAYYFKLYKNRKKDPEKFWDVAGDLSLGSVFLGPILIVLAIVTILLEFKVIR